jgi:methylated-DNA-[protein]-cysteine S-methyltransferase
MSENHVSSLGVKMHNPITKTVSSFQQKVYDALLRVPPGRVTTYKLLAESIGCRSAQAVGQALRRNPYAPEIPCHRVIRSDLTIGGYSGNKKGRKVQQKIQLLQKEGVRFSSGTLTDGSLLFSPK